jgi:hypothetical protein
MCSSPASSERYCLRVNCRRPAILHVTKRRLLPVSRKVLHDDLEHGSRLAVGADLWRDPDVTRKDRSDNPDMPRGWRADR